MRALVLATNELFGYLVAASLGESGVRAGILGLRRWSRARVSRRCAFYSSAGEREFPARIGRLVRHHRIDVLVPADLPSARLLVERRSDLPARCFPLPDRVETLDLLHDKERFAAHVTALGLPHPPTRVISTAEPVDLAYPLIAKPADGEGGLRVRRLGSPEDLRAYFRDVGAQRTVLQTFVDGEDVDVSFLADRGRLAAWTVQRRDPARPALMRFLEDARLPDLARRLAQSVGYHGVAHLDLRVERSTGLPFLLECNPRFWGSLLYSTWAGVNFPRLGLDLAFGLEPDPEFRPPAGDCLHSGIAPRRLLKALCGGRWSPRGLSGASRESWIFNHTDPLPLLWERLQGWWERKRPGPRYG
jgi:predicted ATP-grasp superfamily ATP-dependent carboligase